MKPQENRLFYTVKLASCVKGTQAFWPLLLYSIRQGVTMKTTNKFKVLFHFAIWIVLYWDAVNCCCKLTCMIKFLVLWKASKYEILPLHMALHVTPVPSKWGYKECLRRVYELRVYEHTVLLLIKQNNLIE